MEIKNRLEGICGAVRENVPMSALTSFKTGGPARYLLSPADNVEAEKILSFSAENNIPVLIIGNATNILVSDEGFDGIVLATQKLNRIFSASERIICESGVKISTLIKASMENSLSGTEFLAGIPGTVGGAVISNAGLKTLWLSEILTKIEVLPLSGGKSLTLPREKIAFEYRTSGLENVFICKVEIQMAKGAREKIKESIAGHMKKRQLSQPLDYASAGSVFKNPPGFFAGEMIEKCGLKGYARGDACVSEKHANFIVNKGRVKSADIYGLIGDIRENVRKVYNIELELEIKLVGKF